MTTDEYKLQSAIDKLGLPLSENQVDTLVLTLSKHLDDTLTIYLKNKEDMERGVALEWLVWLQGLQLRVQTNQETYEEGLQRLVVGTQKFINGSTKGDNL